MKDWIKSEYKCPHCGLVMEGGLANCTIHDNTCPEKIIILYSGTSSVMIKRKDIDAESSKSRS